MSKKAYDLMDWAEIEAITYSEADDPKSLLGVHTVKRAGSLIQAYYPGAVKMQVQIGGKGRFLDMELMDEEGYFALLTNAKAPFTYKLRRYMEDESVVEYYDPYSFDQVISEAELKKFNNGINYEAYRMLGSHVISVDGIMGVHFAVWAPNALRVSVVGNFNNWDGRVHQMQRLGDSGVFELFVPGVAEDAVYKYEIKLKNGEFFFKADPYAFGSELRPATASVVKKVDSFKWTDDKWLENRKNIQAEDAPVMVYEVHLGSFKKPEKESGKEFLNYRDIAVSLADYCQTMGYTHVELMPIMEHPLDESWGYQVIGYYAPTSRYGSPEDFQYFVNYMHEKGIGVILDWTPAHFPKDDHGLRCFDGTCLYEHADPRQSEHPHWGTLMYNYGRPEVSNYLIANALYWAKLYHADGIRMDAVASMLYLDYGKSEGQWIPNMYGGKENLEAIELLKHLNSIFKKQLPDVMLVAEESTAWPMVTGDLNNGGLGFDLKWNMGWMNDFLNYMSMDPIFRTHHYNELCFSMIYAYTEKFMLTLSHDEVVHGKGSLISKMPGSIEEKFMNLKAAYGHFITHPGKKLLFMGQDIAEFDEWNEGREVQWFLTDFENHKNMQKYVKDLISLYKSEPALYKADNYPEGFEWINCISAYENIIVYLRKTENIEDTLLVVCNFENIPRNNYKIGVPYPCRLKEIFSSDAEGYGGFGLSNSRSKASKKDECDGREDSIRIKIPPLSTVIFKVIPVQEEEKKEAPIKKKSPASRKKSEEKAAIKKADSAVKSVKSSASKSDKKAAAALHAETKKSPVKEATEDNAKGKKPVRKNNTKNK